MKKRVVAYLDYVDKLLEKEDVDWEMEIKKHLTQISFYAHERVVHLIVTMSFALATVGSILYVNYTGSIAVTLLVVALFILLIPYIMHYYLLENSVQRMYDQYDAMQNKIGNGFVSPERKI